MRVFRQKYRNKRGTLKETSKWYVEIVDHLERTQRIPGYTDKKATEEFGRKLEKLVAFRSLNDAPDPSLKRWLESLGKQTRSRLAKIDLIDAKLDAGGKLLLKHLEDFHDSLRNKNRSAVHCDVQKARIRNVIDGCGFKYSSEINAARVEQYLADARDAGKGISIQTSNYYLQAFKQFCRWLVKERRLSESPVAHLQKLSSRTDESRERRCLTATEIQTLLKSTRSASRHHELDGVDRAMLYRVAMETGLRRGELASLKRESLILEDEHPVILVTAENSKNRKPTVQAIRPELARELEVWLETLQYGPETPLWENLTRRTAEMLKQDLEAAGIPYCDDSGRYADFHALRHSFVSMLAQGGVHPKLAQKLARHSDINLTMNRYSHTLLKDESDALGSLPAIASIFDNPRLESQAAKATGTDGKNLPSGLPEKSANRRVSVPFDAKLAEGNQADRTQPRAKENPCNAGVNASSDESEDSSTGGGTRTRTSVTSLDFESIAQIAERIVATQFTESPESVLPAGLPETLQEWPHLAELIAVWPVLSEDVKSEIMSLIRSAE